jgi:hypothetical protein
VACAACLAVAALPATALAQPKEAGAGSAHAKGSLYLDDDNTQIVTTLVDGEVALPAGTRVGAHVLVDVISAASVDVVSAATPRFDEIRLEGGGTGGVFVTPEVDLGVSFTHSQENDWRSEAPAVTVGLDLFERNTKLVFGYGFVHNTVGRAGDPNFEEEQLGHTAQASITQVLDKKSLVGLAYTFQRLDGWQSSPYRYVTTAGGVFSVLERHPDERTRHAVTTSGLRWLTKGVGLEGSYRFYGDDWGVLSHTLTAGLRFAFLDHWDMRVRARGYYQVAADFWREQYETLMQFMSADRELSTFWDAGGGVKIGWHDDHWTVDAKLEGIYYDFIDFPRLEGRVALVTDLGVGFAW